jgi:hypothetical protein
MTRQSLPRKRVAATVVSLALVEWVLFELVRMPYRPPQDMTTFLGTEKYTVIAFMLLLAVSGLGLFLWWAVRSTWTSRDVTVIATLLAVVVSAGAVAVFAPSWPVTPFELILK